MRRGWILMKVPDPNSGRTAYEIGHRVVIELPPFPTSHVCACACSPLLVIWLPSTPLRSTNGDGDIPSASPPYFYSCCARRLCCSLPPLSVSRGRHLISRARRIPSSLVYSHCRTTQPSGGHFHETRDLGFIVIDENPEQSLRDYNSEILVPIPLSQLRMVL